MKEIIRFGIVGVLATAVQYGLYILLLHVGLSAVLAFTISYAISWLMNFWLSAHFTFRSQATIKRGLGFAASHACNYLLQVVCLKVAISLGCTPTLAPIPVWCICIPVNFLMVRFVFKSQKL